MLFNYTQLKYNNLKQQSYINKLKKQINNSAVAGGPRNGTTTSPTVIT